MSDLAPLVDNVEAFAAHIGVDLFPWQRKALRQACRRKGGRFTYRLAGVSVPRGGGKSFLGAVCGLWRLIAGPPPQDVLSVALDFSGARVVLDHARAILQASPALAEAIEPRADGFFVPSTASRWEIKSAEHTASRGRHATLAIMDEVGWLPNDELFSSLLAGQASVDDPLMLVISTVGKRQSGPLWTVKQLAEGGDRDVLWWYSQDNLSPLVSKAFLARQKRILVPAQYAREHQNQWIDAADSFTTAEDVDRALTCGWRERPMGISDRDYHIAVDVGLTHDPTVVGVAHAEPDGTLCLDTLLTFQGSKRRPVQLDAVEEALLTLAGRFRVTSVQIETWQGVATVQRLQALGLPVTVYTPTPKSQAEQWPLLSHALAEGRLALFPHTALRTELLGLTVEVGPQGAKVIDRGRVHQDHATVLRMLVASLRASATGDIFAASAWRPGLAESLRVEFGDPELGL